MLSYIGGKSTIAKSLIVPNIPKDIEIFIESFSGMFWTFFNMDLENYPNLKNVVYNDFNPLNANLFACLKDHNRLLKECEKVPVQKKGEFPTSEICKEFFNSSQKEVFSTKFYSPNYEIAAKYALVLTNVFSGANPEKGKFIDLKGKYHSKFTSFLNKLRNPKWQKMFESIKLVENKDFEYIIEKYDSPKSYFYCDPPYFIIGEGNYYSNHSFTREDHKRLADCLKSIKGRFSLSYYYFKELEEWFPKDQYNWVEKDFHKSAMAKAGGKQSVGTELLIMNY